MQDEIPNQPPPASRALDRARKFLERLQAHPEDPPQPGEVEALLAHLGRRATPEAAAGGEGVEDQREEPPVGTSGRRGTSAGSFSAA